MPKHRATIAQIREIYPAHFWTDIWTDVKWNCGCKLRSLRISIGSSSRMPASSHSRQMNFFGVFHSRKRRRMTARMTTLP